MKIYSINVRCPICNNKFKGEVLTDYKIKGYRLDFKPEFEEKEDLLKYYIWFCDSCHFSGYDDKFNYEYNKLSFEKEIRNKIRNFKKEQVNLPYKFYHAGEIAEILQEDKMSLIDYYLKSYWIAKDYKNDSYKKKSSKKIISLSKNIIDNPSGYDFEDIFVTSYLLGYLYYEKNNLKKSAFHFLDLVKTKNIPQKYKKNFNFAMKVVKEYEGKN